MKYLDAVDEHLEKLFGNNNPELYQELHDLLQAEDSLIAHQVAVETGATIHRDQVGEMIISSTREAVQACVQACIDQQCVPPDLRAEIEDAFAEAMESAIRHVRSRPGNGGSD